MTRNAWIVVGFALVLLAIYEYSDAADVWGDTPFSTEWFADTWTQLSDQISLGVWNVPDARPDSD